MIIDFFTKNKYHPEYRWIFFALCALAIVLFFVYSYSSEKRLVEISPRLQQSATKKIMPAESSLLPEKVLLEAPFTTQAPLGNWQDVREQNGCEEAALLMAVSWARGKNFSPDEAAKEIRNMSDYHLKSHGHFHDLSNADTMRMLNEYFGYFNAYIKENISAQDIKLALSKEQLVILPVDGTRLGNPFYQISGPLNHKIVVVGYDDIASEFIVHDPGTSRGMNYRYKYDILEKSIEDYPTGFHDKFEKRKASMLVIEK